MNSSQFSFATPAEGRSWGESWDENGSESESEILEVIKNYIQNLFNNIENDFLVDPDEDEEDGFDADGPRRWVTCYGGWSGRSWDLDIAKHREMVRQKQNMFQNGIKIGVKEYYLDPIMYRHNCNNSSFQVKLISEEQYNEYIAKGDALDRIHNKIVANCDEMCKKSQFYRACQMSTKIQYMLQHVKVSGITDFKDALLVAEREEYGTLQRRCQEYTLIEQSLPLLDTADMTILGIEV